MARRRARRVNRSVTGMNEMKGKKCCGAGGAGVVAHILLIAGVYILSSGFLGTFAWRVVLRHPIFWGLFLIFAAFCTFAKAKMHMMYMMHMNKGR